MLPREHQQELLSLAYVRAVANRPGLICCDFERDFGIDMSLREVRIGVDGYVDTGAQIDLQVKSTVRANLNETAIQYDLAVRNYNILRDENSNNSRLLVLFVMPEDEDRWFSQTIDALSLRHCAYWLSLQRFPPTESTKTVRVPIPRENVFSVPALQALMAAQGKRDPS